MNKTIVSLVTAGALGAASLLTPTKADAFAAWVVPTIIAAGAGGIALGGAAASVSAAQAEHDAYSASSGRSSYAYAPGAPASCWLERRMMPSGYMHTVQVCP